jgi:alkylresorcinol/alkylpyrone synthase
MRRSNKVLGATSIGIGHKVPTLVNQNSLRTVFLDKFRRPAEKNPFASKIDKIFKNTGVKHRGVLLDWKSKGSVEDIYKQAGSELTKLASSACNDAFEQAKMSALDIDAGVYVSELPGCPPHDSDLYFGRLGMRHNLVQTPIIGLGCAGGTKGLSTAKSHLDLNKKDAVLVTMSECISRVGATEFEELLPELVTKFEKSKDEKEREEIEKETSGKIVVGALMGDGAAAVVAVGPEHYRYKFSSGPVMVDVINTHIPNTRNFVWTRTHRVGVVTHLGPEIPEVVPDVVAKMVDEITTRNGLTRQDISHWIMHPGGPKVLLNCEKLFDFQNGELQDSWEAIKQAGNCMSVSVVHVLKLLMDRKKPKTGEYGIMMGVGPGMRTQLILLQF